MRPSAPDPPTHGEHLYSGITLEVKINFSEISDRLHWAAIPVVDEVVGILDGGLVPTSLLAHQLGKPLSFVAICFRDSDNTPLCLRPRLREEPDSPPKGSKVLLVDNVSVRGEDDRSGGGAIARL